MVLCISENQIMHRSRESDRCTPAVERDRVHGCSAARAARAQLGCQLSGTAVDCAVLGRPFLVPTRVSPDRGSVHTRRPASRIMDPISAAGGGTDGALVPSASSASSVDLATISSSSLASKASGDQNFLSHPPTSRKWVGTEGLVLVLYSV